MAEFGEKATEREVEEISVGQVEESASRCWSTIRRNESNQPQHPYRSRMTSSPLRRSAGLARPGCDPPQTAVIEPEEMRAFDSAKSWIDDHRRDGNVERRNHEVEKEEERRR
jgi:hypothetical protein